MSNTSNKDNELIQYVPTSVSDISAPIPTHTPTLDVVSGMIDPKNIHLIYDYMIQSGHLIIRIYFQSEQFGGVINNNADQLINGEIYLKVANSENKCWYNNSTGGMIMMNKNYSSISNPIVYCFISADNEIAEDNFNIIQKFFNNCIKSIKKLDNKENMNDLPKVIHKDDFTLIYNSKKWMKKNNINFI